MASNYVQPGKTLSLTAPYDRTTGQGALCTGIFGVALSTVLSGAATEFGVEGVWTLPKTSAQAWAVGAKIFWDDTNKRCDTDATVGPLIGIAASAAANPSATANVRLNGVALPMAEGVQAAVADVATANADGTYGSPEADLINELKTQVNALLARLRAAGIIAAA